MIRSKPIVDQERGQFQRVSSHSRGMASRPHSFSGGGEGLRESPLNITFPPLLPKDSAFSLAILF
jgi:hypothetical protein